MSGMKVRKRRNTMKRNFRVLWGSINERWKALQGDFLTGLGKKRVMYEFQRSLLKKRAFCFFTAQQHKYLVKYKQSMMRIRMQCALSHRRCM